MSSETSNETTTRLSRGKLRLFAVVFSCIVFSSLVVEFLNRQWVESLAFWLQIVGFSVYVMVLAIIGAYFGTFMLWIQYRQDRKVSPAE